MSDVDAAHSEAEASLESRDVPDDRGAIAASDQVLLIVENDENFARFLLDLAHEQGFKALVATKGADALALVQSQPHIDAITLDIQLPVIDGWRVLERLKNDLGTRHIPVYVITTEEETDRAFPMGAIGTLQKPVKTREALEAGLRRNPGDADALGAKPARDQPGRSDPGACPRGGPGGPVGVTEFEQPAEGLGALDAHAFDCVSSDPGRGKRARLRGGREVLRQCASRGIPVALWVPEERRALRCGEGAARPADPRRARPRGAFARPGRRPGAALPAPADREPRPRAPGAHRAPLRDRRRSSRARRC